MSAPTKPDTRGAASKLRAAADSPQSELLHSRSTVISNFNGVRRVPTPINEPVKSYAPGSPERAELKARLEQMSSEKLDIPLIIGGREVRTGNMAQAVMPHAHSHVLADWHRASAEHVTQAIDAAREARREWANW